MLFLNSEHKISVNNNIAQYIKDEKNVLYDVNEARKNVLILVVNSDICPPEVMSYLIHQDLIPDACMSSLQGETHGRKLLQDNLNFVARFMRKEEIF